jgi:hypothetical protein
MSPSQEGTTDMETIITILHVLLFATKVGLGISLIVLFAAMGTWGFDEVKAVRRERKLELEKIRNEDDSFFTDMVSGFNKEGVLKKPPHQAKHRATKHTPTRSFLDTAFDAPKLVLANDQEFFAGLLKEQKELAPLF